MMLDEKQLCAIFLIPFALIGVICNWTVVCLVRKIPTLKHSFGYLSANQAFGDAIHSTTFLLYYCPMAIFDIETMKHYSYHCGFILLFGTEISIQTHLMIALNRFFAAFAPYRYKTLFTDFKTKIIIGVVWVFSLTTTLLYNEIICHLYYDDVTGFFYFTNTPECIAIGWYGDFIKNLVTVIVIVIIDTATVFKVRFINKKVVRAINTQTTDKNSKREWNFLKQAVFQASIFVVELFAYFILPPYLTNRWAIFFSTSFAWVGIHAADGVVTILCNPDFQKYIITRGKHFGSSANEHTHTLNETSKRITST